MLLEQLVESGAVKGGVVAVNSAAVKAYSQRDPKNKRGKSVVDARVGRDRRDAEAVIPYRKSSRIKKALKLDVTSLSMELSV